MWHLCTASAPSHTTENTPETWIRPWSGASTPCSKLTTDSHLDKAIGHHPNSRSGNCVSLWNAPFQCHHDESLHLLWCISTEHFCHRLMQRRANCSGILGCWVTLVNSTKLWMCFLPEEMIKPMTVVYSPGRHCYHLSGVAKALWVTATAMQTRAPNLWGGTPVDLLNSQVIHWIRCYPKAAAFQPFSSCGTNKLIVKILWHTKK